VKPVNTRTTLDQHCTAAHITSNGRKLLRQTLTSDRRMHCLSCLPKLVKFTIAQYHLVMHAPSLSSASLMAPILPSIMSLGATMSAPARACMTAFFCS
jgi:hypothetical protein